MDKDTGQETAAPQAPTVDADKEAWVLARIETAIRIAQKLHTEPTVAAEYDMVNRAIDGVVHGCAAEIIRTLGMEPSFTNVEKDSLRTNMRFIASFGPRP